LNFQISLLFPILTVFERFLFVFYFHKSSVLITTPSL
jgi:hypothetical protein